MLQPIFGSSSLTFTISDPDDFDDRDWGSIVTTSNEPFSLLWTSLGSTPFCEDHLNFELGNDVVHLYREKPSYIRVEQALSGWLGSCTVNGTLTTAGYHDLNLW